MSRPIWKGHISFGLVNIPVVLFSAEKNTDIHFKMIDSRDHAKIRYMRINEQTGEEVPWQEIAKGYEFEDHNYVVIKDEELKEIAGENSKTIDIESFIGQNELDYMDMDKPYYLVPDKKGEKGYVILREILAQTKKIGIARVMIHTRQYLAALMPYENALMLNLLRYHNEIRKPAEFDLPSHEIKAYKVSPKELDVAKQLVASMTSKWQPDAYIDEFQAALQKWLDDRIAHPQNKRKKSHATAKQTSSNVVNFVALLKQSLQSKSKAKPKKAKKAPVVKKAKRKSA